MSPLGRYIRPKELTLRAEVLMMNAGGHDTHHALLVTSFIFNYQIPQSLCAVYTQSTQLQTKSETE